MFSCWECGNKMQEKTVVFSHTVKGEELSFKAKGLVCPCGYKTVARHQMKEYDIILADTYRRKHELLTTEDILYYRKKLLNMSQKEFADFLKVGECSIKRWENGDIQEKAYDELIRLKIEKYLLANNKKTESIVWEPITPQQASLMDNHKYDMEDQYYVSLVYAA